MTQKKLHTVHLTAKVKTNPTFHKQGTCAVSHLNLSVTGFECVICNTIASAVNWVCVTFVITFVQLKLNKEDAMDRSTWRKLIKDVSWTGWVWVGECFSWYRPTRVVPDQRPLNGCVCVCGGVCCICCYVFLCTWQIVSTLKDTMNKTVQQDYGNVDAETKGWDRLQYDVSWQPPSVDLFQLNMLGDQ